MNEQPKEIKTPKNYKPLKPITVGEIPLVYLDSITYLEQIKALIDYIRKTVYPTLTNVIDTTNENVETMNNILNEIGDISEGVEEFKQEIETEWSAFKVKINNDINNFEIEQNRFETSINNQMNVFKNNINEQFSNLESELRGLVQENTDEVNNIVDYLTNGATVVTEIDTTEYEMHEPPFPDTIVIKVPDDLSIPWNKQIDFDENTGITANHGPIRVDTDTANHFFKVTVNYSQNEIGVEPYGYQCIVAETDTGAGTEKELTFLNTYYDGILIERPEQYVEFDSKTNYLTIHYKKAYDDNITKYNLFNYTTYKYYFIGAFDEPKFLIVTHGATPSKYTYFSGILSRMEEIIKTGSIDVTADFDKEFNELKNYVNNIQTNNQTQFNTIIGQIDAINKSLNEDFEPLIGEVAGLSADIQNNNFITTINNPNVERTTLGDTTFYTHSFNLDTYFNNGYALRNVYLSTKNKIQNTSSIINFTNILLSYDDNNVTKYLISLEKAVNANTYTLYNTEDFTSNDTFSYTLIIEMIKLDKYVN